MKPQGCSDFKIADFNGEPVRKFHGHQTRQKRKESTPQKYNPTRLQFPLSLEYRFLFR